jgi:DNA-binding FadR family transcriptional regulator
LLPCTTTRMRSHTPNHTCIASKANFDRTVDCHLAVLDAIGSRRPDAAVSASDALTDFVDHMFDAMEQELDPELLGSGESAVIA